MAANSTSQLSIKTFDIIAQETGIASDELEADTEFSSLGVNDYLTQSIISKIAQEAQLDLPQDIFVEYPTVESLRIYLKTIAISSAIPKMPLKKKASSEAEEPASPL